MALDDLCFPLDDSLNWAKFKAGWWWLVRYKGKIVGFASAVRVNDASIGGAKENVVVLTRAAVHPEHRGHHLQQRLIEHRVAWAKQQGVSSVVTYTVPGNCASANNLIAAGFRCFSPDEWPTGEAVLEGTEVHWRLKLKS